ncbi:ubiquitin carboxyl-terminal hydrolase 39 isoform X2 [Rhineura floridana]|uniref:ubiquitin carboxyl-terminal hydrolase 39 isoform X2 n=1 Tax=Rhineura floridana TaxID=261503 RepID=UPI002AC8001E|nr:ubiquitin carboxyl-terminal hydrolase 39 isoform X2 [Rhineura floridana]
MVRREFSARAWVNVEPLSPAAKMSARVKRERDSRLVPLRSSLSSRAQQDTGGEGGVSRGVSRGLGADPVQVKREPVDEEPRIKQEPVDEDDEEPTVKYGRFDPEDRRSRHCPYLDTINKSVLDFDFEKLCSISLSHINVYACLVCGKYFQGRGLKSHAYIHSVQFSHHVFLNLHTLKFYCLPDNYEIIDSSLEDITYVLKPTFTKQHIANLDKQAKLSRAYDGTTYLPGIVGLNNIKANDYANAVLQALSNVPPLRNYFLEEENYKNIKRPPGDIMFLLVQRFGELMRKLWNPRNFKAHVSPHEMLQAVVLCSKKNFQITKQGDAVEFLSWFLNALHSALGGTKKKKKTIVTDVFQGSMRIFTKKLPHPDLPAEEKEQLLQNDEYQEKMVESTFMYLTLDLPTAPLYKDEKEQLIIPQVPLFNILAKFNGITEKEYKTYKENFLKRFQLTKLPPYLIFCIKRFTKNNFFVEKNPTIVNFPITNVDLREYLSEEVQAVHKNTTYDLIANIVHDGKPAEGAYRIHVLHHGTGKWYELQDLQVTDILPQMITLSEAYIQIWKRRDSKEETNRQGA